MVRLVRAQTEQRLSTFWLFTGLHVGQLAIPSGRTYLGTVQNAWIAKKGPMGTIKVYAQVASLWWSITLGGGFHLKYTLEGGYPRLGWDCVYLHSY